MSLGDIGGFPCSAVDRLTDQSVRVVLAVIGPVSSLWNLFQWPETYLRQIRDSVNLLNTSLGPVGISLNPPSTSLRQVGPSPNLSKTPPVDLGEVSIDHRLPSDCLPLQILEVSETPRFYLILKLM